MKLQDLRKVKPVYFSSNGLLTQSVQDDKSIYDGYVKGGDSFLNTLNGEFGIVYQDEQTSKIFAVRDWIGEVPLHYIVRGDTAYFANFISDLVAIPDYNYADVAAVNRSEVVEIDNMGLVSKHLYYNFNNDRVDVDYGNIEAVAEKVHDLLFEAVKTRMPQINEEGGLLLSGGIDSMFVAFLVSRFNKNIPAYTITVASQQSTDVLRALNITKAFGLKHNLVDVTKDEIINAVEESVSDSEIYHMYNVFCAVGMNKLASVLKQKGIKYVFTGEGGNEVFGDYHDWIVKDPHTKQELVLQRTSKDFDEPAGREAYVWGNLKAESLGRYNVQLGSGLGKHGGSRMYKPMFKRGITLLSPYLQKDITKIITNIPTQILKKLGGKPGFMKMVFQKEINSGELPAEFFEVKKIRFQDASEGGEKGITETLLEVGHNQAKLIEIYNKLFKANVKEMSHLTETILIK